MTDDREMTAYYERGDEQARLGDWGRLEYLRTRELPSRFLHLTAGHRPRRRRRGGRLRAGAGRRGLHPGWFTTASG
jgi:hypothetical protein